MMHGYTRSWRDWMNYDDTSYRHAKALMKAEKARERRNRRRVAKKRNIGNQWN